jgi:arylsulfatase A-like enzyme
MWSDLANTCRRLHFDIGTMLRIKFTFAVPGEFKWPGTIAANSIEQCLVDSSDFLPTLMEIAGIEPKAEFEMDGRSFVPQLKGETGNPREWMYFHFEPMSPNSSL